MPKTAVVFRNRPVLRRNFYVLVFFVSSPRKDMYVALPHALLDTAPVCTYGGNESKTFLLPTRSYLPFVLT